MTNPNPTYSAEGHRALLQAIDYWVDLKMTSNGFMPSFRESARSTILARAAELSSQTQSRDSSLRELATDTAGDRGWVLVPIKPTKEMLLAAYDRSTDGTTDMYHKTWAAMLAAAPQPPQGGGE